MMIAVKVNRGHVDVANCLLQSRTSPTPVPGNKRRLSTLTQLTALVHSFNLHRSLEGI